ncbi:dTDP-glucose 4,6-dehydratase [bacterium]|nr:dTDP-glucose 4,6-dehydratase [bacterium]
MQRLLVTGGLGFIGSAFVRLLLESDREFSLTNLDKLSYAGNPLNLADVEDDPRYELVVGDIADQEHVDWLFSEGRFDNVVNFAAESHVDNSILSSAPFIDTNVRGTQVLLDTARQHGIERFLQVSTDEVYGSLGPTGRFTEDSPLKPNNPYSASKASADLLCRAYFVTHKLPVLVTRCSNNYGPGQFPEKLIPLITARALKDERLPVYGDGLQVRDWLYVEDHCRAILTVLEKGRPGEVYNIGGGRELPNLELVKLILDKLNKPHELIEHVTDRPGHDRRYAISYDKLKAELGWEPRVEFQEGIARTIDWYLGNPEWLAAIAAGTYQDGYK